MTFPPIPHQTICTTTPYNSADLRPTAPTNPAPLFPRSPLAAIRQTWKCGATNDTDTRCSNNCAWVPERILNEPGGLNVAEDATQGHEMSDNRRYAQNYTVYNCTVHVPRKWEKVEPPPRSRYWREPFNSTRWGGTPLGQKCFLRRHSALVNVSYNVTLCHGSLNFTLARYTGRDCVVPGAHNNPRCVRLCRQVSRGAALRAAGAGQWSAAVAWPYPRVRMVHAHPCGQPCGRAVRVSAILILPCPSIPLCILHLSAPNAAPVRPHRLPLSYRSHAAPTTTAAMTQNAVAVAATAAGPTRT